jgi:hypothetical protein
MRVRTTIVTLAAAIVASAFPLPRTVAPDWTITTLDVARRPLTGITVREVWQQYSVEDPGHEEDRLTDIKGEYISLDAFTGQASRADSLVVHGKSPVLEFTRAAARIHTWSHSATVLTLDWADLRQEEGTTMRWQHSTLVLKH